MFIVRCNACGKRYDYDEYDEAKEIIRECMGQMTFHDCEYTDAYKKAEAFLKECENT